MKIKRKKGKKNCAKNSAKKNRYSENFKSNSNLDRRQHINPRYKFKILQKPILA